jgi:hypothetical protein
MAVYALFMLFFCTEYVFHEHVHLYTYDIFAEKVSSHATQTLAS